MEARTNEIGREPTDRPNEPRIEFSGIAFLEK